MTKSVAKHYQRHHYDDLAAKRRESKVPFSCSFDDRYDPFLLVNDNELFQQFYVTILEKIKDGKGVVLDCCSGSGVYLPLLSCFSKVLVGIDLSYGLLQESKKINIVSDTSQIFIAQSEAESIPLKSDTCDLIVMIDSFHHIEEPGKVLEELKRVAKRDASFLLIEPNVVNPLVFLAHLIPKEERGAIRRNTKARIQRMLTPYIRDIEISGLNYVASNQNGAIGKRVSTATTSLFSNVFTFWPIRLLFFGKFK